MGQAMSCVSSFIMGFFIAAIVSALFSERG